MRVSTLFNRILALPGTTVVGVRLAPDGVVVELRLRRRRLVCPCGTVRAGRYDVGVRRWRHLDLGGCKLFVSMPIRRLRCASCGRVRTEAVPFARPGARHTRVFEDYLAWCAQRMDKTAVARLLRTSWTTVDRIVGRVVSDALDQRRFQDLRRIGVDEVSYRRGHRYLTVVVDHDHGGRVIWAGEGRKADSLGAFFASIGPERAQSLEAISMDLGVAYLAAAQRFAPAARVCLDPFHVISLANKALEDTRKQVRQLAPSGKGLPGNAVRWALLKAPVALSETQRCLLEDLRRSRSQLYRAWALKEDLRGLYALEDPSAAARYLDRWCSRARRSRIPAMANLASALASYRAGIVAAVELGLSNSRLEGMNSKIRLLNHRGYGHHSAAALIGVIYLACGGLSLALPVR